MSTTSFDRLVADYGPALATLSGRPAAADLVQLLDEMDMAAAAFWSASLPDLLEAAGELDAAHDCLTAARTATTAIRQQLLARADRHLRVAIDLAA